MNIIYIMYKLKEYLLQFTYNISYIKIYPKQFFTTYIYFNFTQEASTRKWNYIDAFELWTLHKIFLFVGIPVFKINVFEYAIVLPQFATHSSNIIIWFCLHLHKQLWTLLMFLHTSQNDRLVEIGIPHTYLCKIKAHESNNLLY